MRDVADAPDRSPIHVGAASTAAPPAPAVRVHFLDEQRRRRRASFSFGAFAVVAVAVSGVPLCVLITPPLFGALLILAHAVNLLVPLPPPVWSALRDAAHVLPDAWSAVRGGSAGAAWPGLALLVLGPGAVAMLCAWMWIRLHLRDAGPAALIRRLGARPSDPSDPRERRLANLVQELAVAAGVPAPRVMVIDAAAVNATAIGPTLDSATVIATTGLLERLDRAESQAIVAHVVASVGHGDLRIAALILSVVQTWGLLALLLDAPFGERTRTALRYLYSVARRDGRGLATDEERSAAAAILLEGAGHTHDDLMQYLDEVEHSGTHPLFDLFVKLPLLLTFGVAAIAAKAAIALFTLLVAGPVLAPLWRTRRFLADAGAVQLTRDPEALARALGRLSTLDLAVPGGAPANFLFVTWPKAADTDPERTDVMSNILGMHPEIGARLERLRALGAPGDPERATAARRPLRARVKAALPSPRDLGTFVLWGAVAVLIVAGLFAVNLATTGLLLLAVWAVLQLALVALPLWLGRLIRRSP